MRSSPADGSIQLSVRQAQILTILCREALATKEIAWRLRLAESTVAGYIDDLVRALRLGSRARLVLWAMQHPQALQGERCERRVHPPRCKCGLAGCGILDFDDAA